MKNVDAWVPTKFKPEAGEWTPTNDTSELSPGSIIAARCQLSALVPAIRANARGRFLDLGCGKVPFYGVYKNLVDDITCVDWAQSPHGINFIDKECDLNQPLPFPSESFDTILATSVLEHIERPEDLWSELGRILAPGGRIIVEVPFFYWLHEEPYDFYRYTRHKLEQFCDEADFRIIGLASYGGVPEIICDLVSKQLVDHWRLSSLFHRLSRRMLRSRFLQRISNQTRNKFPLGYLLVAERTAKVSVS